MGRLLSKLIAFGRLKEDQTLRQKFRDLMLDGEEHTTHELAEISPRYGEYIRLMRTVDGYDIPEPVRAKKGMWIYHLIK